MFVEDETSDGESVTRASKDDEVIATKNLKGPKDVFINIWITNQL